jgi:hypothetical protein
MRIDVGKTGSCPIVGVEVSGSAALFKAWGFSQMYLC